MCLHMSGGGDKGRIRSSAQRPLRFLARALVLLVLLPAIAMEEALDLAPLPQRSRRAFGTAAPPGTDAAGPPRAHARAEPAMVPPAAPVDIDGSMLEGGGQIIRVCSALSALLGTPIRLQKIRAGRPKGGLAAQHAAGLKLVSEMCGAALEGASIGSSTVTMRPGPLAQRALRRRRRDRGRHDDAAERSALLLRYWCRRWPHAVELAGDHRAFPSARVHAAHHAARHPSPLGSARR